MEKICVAVRVRPPVSQDISNGGTFWKVDDNRISLHKPHGTPISGVSYAFGKDLYIHTCTFISVFVFVFVSERFTCKKCDFVVIDHVFDEGCKNSRVYELLTKDIIHAAVEGFNGI